MIQQKPYGLERLEVLRDSAPQHPCFDVTELDAIAHGENYAASALDGYYASWIFSSLSWWFRLAAVLADGRSEEWSPDTGDTEFRRDLEPLFHAVACALTPAIFDSPSFASPEQDGTQSAAMHLFSCYRHMTQVVRAKALQVWPDQDLAWLWVQP